MKTRRMLFRGIVLSVLVGTIGAVIVGNTPAYAGSTSLTIPIAGTVTGLSESVSLSGNVQITSKPVTDSTFGSPPKVLLSFLFVNVSGVGKTTGHRYVAQGEVYRTRPLAASDAVKITFPFFPDGPGGSSSARSGQASFTITFDSTGLLTQVTGTISDPVVPAPTAI